MSNVTAAHPAEIAPDWFTAALAEEPEVSRVDVEGAGVEVLSWGERGKPGLLLMHGFLCSADWWRFTAPLLARDFRVCAFSWSGMGGSDWREAYTFDLMAAEAMAVAEAGGLFAADRPPVFAAHSFGSLPLFVAADRYGDRLAGAVAIDSVLGTGSDQRPSRPDLVRRIEFATREAALARFRLTPPAEAAPSWMMDFIAASAVRQVLHADGVARWERRGDQNVSAKTSRRPLVPHFSAIRCPFAMITGQRSHLFQDEGRAWFKERAPAHTQWIEIPEAGHHPMLDQPLALLEQLRAVATDFSAGA
jgi:pimeloyl-ACP methyl ester carboxylesterase